MTIAMVFGMILVLASIIGIGIYSGRKVKNASDFLSGGGQAGPWLVCGSIMGSLVSSQATIGTAQLAFHYGLAAWWFTLGSGIGCLVLALGYVKPLRKSGCITEMQIISHEYGSAAGSLSSILCSVGIFISVLAQVVACVGLISTLFPSIPLAIAAIAAVGVMCFYVIFGGAWGAGMGGVVKLLLLCAASAAGLIYTLAASGGLAGLTASLSQLLSGTAVGLVQKSQGLSELTNNLEVTNRFFHLTARGAMKDIGSGFSLLLGVLSTQTYAQAIWSAKTDRKAKQGALLSAFLIPPIGIAGISIGLYMRANYITQSEVDALISLGETVPNLPVLTNTIQVFPTFVMDHMPSLFAGIILGTLLITVVGGGAGLSLGMATIMVKDIYKRITCRIDTVQKELIATRGTIAVILAIAALITIVIPSSTINDLGFLSMGLRGTVVFLPLCGALWFPGKIDPRCILASIVLSPLTVIFGNLLECRIDPLFLGLAVGLICSLLGWIIRSRRSQLDLAQKH